MIQNNRVYKYISSPSEESCSDWLILKRENKSQTSEKKRVVTARREQNKLLGLVESWFVSDAQNVTLFPGVRAHSDAKHRSTNITLALKHVTDTREHRYSVLTHLRHLFGSFDGLKGEDRRSGR